MINITKYGYIETETPPEGQIPGRVTEVQREKYTVMTAFGEVSAVLKGSFYHQAYERSDFPCVGDFVFLQYVENGDSRIAKVLPRRSKFSRADFSGHTADYTKTILEQVVAANFDYVFILSSLNMDFKVNRIMRYLTQVWQSGGMPVVVLTKADLNDNYTEAMDEVRIAAPGVHVHAVSAHTGFGLHELNAYLKPGKTAVFLGMSGVGKSSLLNALMAEDVMAVSDIREDDSRGRHTTTHRQLFMLPPVEGASSGAMIIDTPGMRELGLFNADNGISNAFSDIEEVFTGCRFSDCRHRTEPGCAVRAALEDGTLSRESWERYLAQKRENKFVNDKTGYLAAKKEWQKDIAKWNKQIKKNGKVKR